MLANTDQLEFKVTDLEARVPEGVPLQWQGRELDSGPLRIELAPGAEADSRGVMDYERGRAAVEFHVLLSFPELADELRGLGVDENLVRPVRAVLRSEGAIRDDHRLALSGRCTLHPHELFPKEESSARVLDGH
ncbi:MAG: hypothetical protein ACYTGZ_16225 [Planctomycetota bacterium]|jgi:hypothetical protein